jgi:hypothetical protein
MSPIVGITERNNQFYNWFKDSQYYRDNILTISGLPSTLANINLNDVAARKTAAEYVKNGLMVLILCQHGFGRGPTVQHTMGEFLPCCFAKPGMLRLAVSEYIREIIKAINQFDYLFLPYAKQDIKNPAFFHKEEINFLETLRNLMGERMVTALTVSTWDHEIIKHSAKVWALSIIEGMSGE